jgi:hypothetical protein
MHGGQPSVLERGMMEHELTLFISTFTTLLAIINPLEALPVFLRLLEGTDDASHRRVARRACLYALLLAFFFLVSQVAITLDYRYQPRGCAPIDAGVLVADNGKTGGYRYQI